MNMLSNILQQFVIMVLGGLALFLWGYYMGYTKSYQKYIIEDIEPELDKMDLEEYKRKEEYQMQ